MATLAKLLQVDMGLPDMAKRLAAAGRGKDSILAHINPKEMALLKKHGGSGKINPKTGIIEFDDGDTGGYDTGGFENQSEVSSAPAPKTQNVPTVEAGPPPAEAAPVPIEQDKFNFINNPKVNPDSSSFVGPRPEDTLDKQFREAGITSAPAGLQTDMSVARSPISPAATPAQTTSTVTGDNLGASQRNYSSASLAATQPPAEPSFTDKLKGYSDDAAALNKTLQPFAPWAKVGTSALALYQGQQAANKQNAAAAANEAEIRKLADPYRAQAEQIAQQGQQMLQMGQQGGLTAAQQQKLETQRAQAMQQQAQAGITGGTAAQETEAMIQRQAAQFAQDNVTQGLQLISQAQSISGTADALIKQAISTGYTQSVDASKLASDFYNALGFSLPETASKGPAQAQPQTSTEAPVDLSQEATNG